MSCLCRAFCRSSSNKYAEKNVPADISWKETKIFVPPVTEAHVIKVYDGDTITVATKLPFNNELKDTIWRFSVRLNGIDCPEIKGKSESEKRVAQIAKNTLSNKILDKTVLLEDVQLEKYGRLLAIVKYQGQNLNDWMVSQNLAVAYDGGTKHCPADWEEYYKSKLTDVDLNV